MVLKLRSPQYVIIFTIYLLKQFHSTSPQNETDSRTISLFTSTEAPGKSTPVAVTSATQNHSRYNNESSIFSGVQTITLLLQNNASVQPTYAAPQVNSTQMPTLNSQENSVIQPTATLALQQNLTVQPTGTLVAVKNSIEEPTKLATSATAQVTSALIPTSQPQWITDPSPSDTGVRFAFRAKKYNFDLNLLNKDSEVYKKFERELSNEFTTNLGQYGVKGVTILFIRPGSVEVTTVLTVNDRNNVSNVEGALNNFNQTGRIGNIELVGIFWKSEDESCQPPVVRLLNLPRSEENKDVGILRSKDFIVHTFVNTSCKPPQKLLFGWRLFKYSLNQSNNTIIEMTTTLDSKTAKWNLQKRQLDYGLYFVEFKAALENHPEAANSALGYFQIRKSLLIADILGGNKVTRGKGSVIRLDASASRDPDVEPGNHSSMDFTWLCKRREESFPNSSLASVPVVNASSGPGRGGCFGTGVGKLSSNNMSVYLETTQMIANKSYDVKLVVRKDDRADEFVQEINIVSGNPPKVIIRCLLNCDKIASASARISLTTECIGDPCKGAKHHWQLTVVDPGGVNDHVVELTDKTETNLNSIGIVIKKNQLKKLKPGWFYRLEVEVSQQGGPSGYATYQFSINDPPQNGSCSVTPTIGEALKTQFVLECRDWEDSHKPITYQFHYKTDNGLYTLISYGSENLVSTVLPPGKKQHDYMIKLEVTVSDSLSAAKIIVLQIKVTPAKKESLSTLTVGNSSQFNQLVLSGDVRGATQLANAVLQSAEQTKSTTFQEKIAIKDSVVKSVSEIQVGNLQTLTQVTSVIARATLQPSEVTFHTQKLALKTLRSMTSILSSRTTEDYASESVLVDEGGENLVLCLGNLLYSAAQKADVVSQTKKPADIRFKSENVSRDTEKLIDDVATALLSKMLVDQETRRVHTSSIDMELRRMSPRSRGASADFTDDDEAGFKFSLDAIIDDEVKTPEYVESVLTVSAFNPFTWDNSSAVVRDSHVLTLNLKDNKGEPFIVRDSKEDIEIKIPRKLRFTREERVSFFVKPSSEGKMQYHEINSPGEEGNALRLRITPERPTIFRVFVRQGQRPTVTEYDLTKTIPDESCSTSPQTCSKEAYDVVLYHELVSEAGKYYIGILYEEGRGTPQRRRKRSCFGSGRQKRSCVEIKDPPKPENKTVKPVYDSKTDMNYSMNILEESCVFWESKEQHWLSRGCRVGPRSDSSSLHCLCNHLTSFGGGVLVMPNRLDFDVVFAELGRLDQTGNIAVLSAIIIVLLLYLLVVIFARKADKRDKAKEGPAFHLPLTQGATYEYDLTVVTGVWRESGTDANVAVVIHGSEAESQPIILHKNMINSRTILARGNDDKFVIYLPVSLGIVQYIRVWHDNSGKSPSWYFGHAIVRDRQTGRKWTFISNSWLALEKGEGRIDKILTPISRREMKTFKHSLNSRGSKSFSEGHLWLSVVTKPPRNKFTRVQRATCCLCLLFSAMLANALFYRTDETADPTIQIGPLKFSWRQIVVGIESALIVTPVNLLITSLFKNSAKKPSKKVDITKLEDKPEPVRRNRYSSLSCEQDTSCEKVAWKNETSFWTRTRKRMCDKTKKDFFCPHFCIYISWFLSFATVSVSALFTFFFSLMWGKDIANQWLSSMLVSFTEDLFVLQPIKIVLIMVLVACFFSDRVDTDFSPVKNHKTTEQLSPLETEVAYDAKGIIVEMPEEAVLEQAREYRVKEEKMYSFGRELLMYLLFLLLLTTVCYGNRSYHGYLMTKNIKDIFSNYSLAKDPRFFWSWLNGQFVDGIYAGEWYNKDRVKEQEYIGNKMSILLGVPRLRQLRVQKDSCMIPEESKEVVRHCNDFYSLSEEDRTHLSLPGWRPFTGSVSWANLSDLCPAPWRYVTMEKIHNSPSWGFFHVYDGGGYIADLGYSKLTAEGIITNLREYGWLDRQTRAVLLEFSVYNPNTGYISISTYHYEILPTGYGNPFAKIDTLPLTSTQTGFYRFYLICQLLFILMVIFFMLKEFYNIFKKKCSYFRNAWNWVEILQIMFSFLVVVFYVLKSKMILKSVVKVKKNPFVSVSFGEAVDWSHAENSVLALTVFTTTVKLLRMIRFNPHVSIMMSSLRLSRGLLVSYSVILAIIILSYAQLGRLALGGYMLQYSSFQRTLFTEFVMCLGGKMDLEDLTRANRVLGPLFGFSFRGLMSFIFVNFFVAIFNDSYEEIKDNTHKQSKNFEMHDFILERLRELLGFKKETQRENDVDNNPATPKHTAPESVSHEKLTFTSVAVSSQRLCRMARRKQPRISKEENRNERATVVRFKCESTAKMADVEARKRRIQKLKCVTSSFFVMKSLTRERMFRRMSDLTDKLAMDEVEQDKELLSIIRFLLLMNSYYDDCYRMCSPDKTSSYDDNAITSLTTPSSSPISRIDMETSEPGETLELLRSRETSRPLPYHLRGMELREQLRSTLATKRAKRVKPKPSNSFIYKHYAFL